METVELSPEIRKKLELEDLNYTQEELEKSYSGIYNCFGKRIIDFVLGCIGLALIWPFLLLIALAVVRESGFPVFYRPLRGGYRGKPFRIFKFRSMIPDADKVGGGTTALGDPRITRVGAFLRKTKLDETPQLFNILNGTMSFIGPRPELLQYTSQYAGLEKNILNVRPGITDYSSVNFINLDEIVGAQNADEMYERYVLKRKNQLRLKYAATVSFGSDCKIFCATVFSVLRKAAGTLRGKQ